ncbi:hypothetical protein HOP50_19g84180 [Chloropicon primus]|nr:hypothetical protein HOP50_19g84180 [Chloropicon primus]
MDVFVVTYEDVTHVDLYHMNLKRLWSIQGKRRATALTWKPDGTWLALGYEDGSISLVETETGDAHACAMELSSSGTRSSPIKLLHWQDANDWVPVTRAEVKAKAEVGRVSGGFSLLCSCDAEMMLQVSAHGLIPLAKVDIKKQVEEALPPSDSDEQAPIGLAPLALSANSGFTQVLVSFSLESAGKKVLMSALLDTSALSDMRSDIWHWADYISMLEGDVSKLRATMKSLRPQLSHLNQNYPWISQDGGAEGNGSKYQMTLSKLNKSLLLGYSSVANSMVVQKSCKASAVEIDKALAKLYQVLTYDFLPQLEAVYQHLQGYASRSSFWNAGFFEKSKSLDGETNLMGEMFQYTSEAILLAQSLQPSILACSRQAREYFAWLHSSQLSLDKEELPHSQIKALLQSERMSGAILGSREPGAGKGAEAAYMDWTSLAGILEDFQEQIASLAYCFGNCIVSPCKLFSERVKVGALDVMEEVEAVSKQNQNQNQNGGDNQYRVAADLVTSGEVEAEQDFWNVVVYRVLGSWAKIYTVASSGVTGKKDLSFEEGEISSFSFYKWPYLTWIVGSSDADGGEASMVIMNRKEGAVEDTSICVTEGAHVRSRALGGTHVEHFAVSKNRGTAYIQDAKQNVVVFDLEDD